tara:strand:+ start:1113 stop:2546 length:1434 start_codon:yes stop_codon:yes gene_type:complete
MNKIFPVILCGGQGSRLWPLSRPSYPKQYLKIDHQNSKTFLQETAKRFNFKNVFTPPLIICNEEHRFLVAEQMREINTKPLSILLEPFGRDTLPAIAISAFKLSEEADDPLMIILPSDHIIKNNKKFIEIILKTAEYADQGNIITFGVNPEYPEAGYGYIQSEKKLNYEVCKPEKISRFIEKPNLNLANKLILDKKFSWNSGIFFFKTSVFLKELKEKCPEIFDICKKSISNKIIDLDFERITKDLFSNCPSISIDKGIMEKTNLGLVVPLNIGWSDAGNWQSLWEISKKDDQNNFISGNVITDKVKNCYLRSEERLLVGIGIENLIIVETNDAILISNKENSQDVKNIFKKMVDDGNKEAKTHKKVYRPWGSYTSIVNGEKWQVKRIIVNPGESLSLQKHFHRTEHWIVVSGIAKVEIEGKKNILTKNQSTYIPKESKHRLSNPGEETLIVIEVQSGEYLGEDDIIRFEDNYGRDK